MEQALIEVTTAVTGALKENPVALMAFFGWISTAFFWRQDVKHYRETLKGAFAHIELLTASVDALSKGLEYLKGALFKGSGG